MQTHIHCKGFPLGRDGVYPVGTIRHLDFDIWNLDFTITPPPRNPDEISDTGQSSSPQRHLSRQRDKAHKEDNTNITNSNEFHELFVLFAPFALFVFIFFHFNIYIILKQIFTAKTQRINFAPLW